MSKLWNKIKTWWGGLFGTGTSTAAPLPALLNLGAPAEGWRNTAAIPAAFGK